MNSNQIINMLTRMFVRKAMGQGIKLSAKAMSSGESAGRATPQEDRNDKIAQREIRRARKTMRMTKKMTRF